MTPSPNQVHIQHWATAHFIGEEMETQQAVYSQHCQCTRQHWESGQNHHGSHQAGPSEDRHLHQSHARSAHAQDGYHHVDTGQQSTQARQLQGPDIVVHTHARAHFNVRQWRISQPTCGRKLTQYQ